MATYEKDGKKVVIIQDEDPPNPRKEYDNLGTMICVHGRYDLGDKSYSSHVNVFDLMVDVLAELSGKDVESLQDNSLEEIVKEIEEYAVILPLYLYDHSGLSMRTSPFSCKWDSGQVGYIYLSLKNAREEWPESEDTLRSKAEEYLKNEVRTYDTYLRGDVIGYECWEGDNMVDSCWGIYGLEDARLQMPTEFAGIVREENEV